MRWCYPVTEHDNDTEYSCFKKELTRQFTAIPIWWKMLKVVLSRQNQSYLDSMALPEKSSQFVAILSTIYIQYLSVWGFHFLPSNTSQVKLLLSLLGLSKEDGNWQWMILFVVCITRNMEWMCKICIEIHLIEVCISFYWWFHRCKS